MAYQIYNITYDTISSANNHAVVAAIDPQHAKALLEEEVTTHQKGRILEKFLHEPIIHNAGFTANGKGVIFSKYRIPK